MKTRSLVLACTALAVLTPFAAAQDPVRTDEMTADEILHRLESVAPSALTGGIESLSGLGGFWVSVVVWDPPEAKTSEEAVKD